MSENEPTMRELTFEEAYERLERITEEIERGEIGLEESIARYEEGMKLAQRCRKILEKAEARVQKLAPKEDGTLGVEDSSELGDG
jgi:exodeoxyribonuclease VII small subunit